MKNLNLLLCVTLAVFIHLPGHAKEPTERKCPFEVWLGRQSNSGPFGEFSSAVVSKPSKALERKIAEVDLSWKVSVSVVHGAHLELPVTSNGYTTTVNGTVSSVRELEMLMLDKESSYIVAIISPREKSSFRNLLSLNIRVTEGPLKNAIVHLRNDKFPADRTNGFVAVYRVPDLIWDWRRRPYL